MAHALAPCARGIDPSQGVRRNAIPGGLTMSHERVSGRDYPIRANLAVNCKQFIDRPGIGATRANGAMTAI